LAARYGADLASAEWRHMGRLAGFTNRKLDRRQDNGLPPWVRVIWQCPGALAVIEDLVDAPAFHQRFRKPLDGSKIARIQLVGLTKDLLRLRKLILGEQIHAGLH
jgi:hypothetical protein